MEHTSNENIVAALKLLEEAAKQKKDEVVTAMADRCTSLKKLIVENEVSLVKSLTAAKDRALAAAAGAKEASVEKARALAGEVDQRVHRNPWPFIAASAMVGLLLGCFLSRRRR